MPNVGFEDESPTQSNDSSEKPEEPLCNASKEVENNTTSPGTELAINSAERRRRKLPEIPKQSKSK